MAAAMITSRPAGEAQPSASKPLPRRPTLVRKRDEAALDDEKDAIPSSPTKKAKVAFNNEVEVITGDWDKAPELIRGAARRTLERHLRGESDEYERIKQIYAGPGHAEPPTASMLRNHTAALVSNVSLLNRQCSGLVRATLSSDWIRRDESYVSLFVRYLASLVSTQGMWLAETLQSLVRMFLQIPKSKLSDDELPPVSPEDLRKRVHSCIRTLLKMVPSATHTLAEAITTMFPPSFASKRAHVRYVHNLLTLIGYAPELRSEILGVITDRVVKIDVQIQTDIEGLADDAGEDVVQSISQLREELVNESDDEDSDDDSDLDDDELDSEARRQEEITANVEKLDLVLDLLFENYANLFSDASTQQPALDILISQFSTVILPTYRSRHTQFLLFHFAQTSPELIDIFIGILLRTAFDTARAAMVRQSAAAYLASFVARGIHVSSSIVRDVFDFISLKLSEMRDQHIVTCRGPDPRRYSNYYSLFQAILYIFCFRWRDLTASADDSLTPSPSATIYDEDDIDQHPRFASGIKETLNSNVFSPLNPLKVCAPPIVHEFAKISHHVGITYVFHLLETNKRVRIVSSGPVDHRETALSRRQGEEWQRLEAYFPFDPYHLPRSKRWLEGDYRGWNPIPGLHDKDDQSGSDDDEEDDEDDDSEGTGTDSDE